ncbi:MAG: peptidoglycan-binding protein [Clostridia bacterium]|nr:peptidoglycan-binding protein [Clostridia bacterium]
MRRLLAGLFIIFIICALWAGNFGVAYGITEEDRTFFIDNLLDIADHEIGYQREAHGYTKYADWSGGNKYGEWCSDFMSWCVAQTDLRLGTNYLHYLYPMQTACAVGVRWFTERGRYVTATGELKGFGAQWYWEDGVSLSQRPYIPQRGDLIYFEWFRYNRIDHVGIVEYVQMEPSGRYIVHTIEGNGRLNGQKVNDVRRFSYPLDHPTIRAYGVIRDDVGTDLTPGSVGPQVERLQRLLVEGGFADFEPDGVYGARTRRAVSALQAVYGLEETGVAGRAVQLVLGLPPQ